MEGGERRERRTKSQRGREGRGGTSGLRYRPREGYLMIYAGVPRVPSHATADEAGLPILSHGRYEEPVRSWSSLFITHFSYNIKHASPV